MIDIWFGLDAAGFEKARALISEIYTVPYSLAADFDPTFGPILMVTYACLSNTLLLTGMSPLRARTTLANARSIFAVLVSVGPVPAFRDWI